MPTMVDMTGERCGRLTVVELAPRDSSSRVKWTCRCDCGRIVAVDGAKLRSGHTRSCGCIFAPAIERFAEKIALTETGCIEWLAGTNGVGYGLFYAGEGSATRGYAHRWSYEYHVGPIPDGLHIDHLCRNRACVNPDHLEPVTPAENVLRGMGMSALNARKTHCPEGHALAGENLYIGSKGERRCRACGRMQARAHYWSNPEKHRAYARNYKAKQKQEA